jgi:NADH-quinone oxidoreductase subunit E
MNLHRKIDLKTLHYVGEEGKLIPALQKEQEKEGYISRAAIDRIHQSLGVPLSHIYGVATFYAQFRMNPVGKHMVRVCHGTACHVSGANGISEAVEETLKVKPGETTSDKLFTLERVSCLGCCSLAPVVMVDGFTYGNLTAGETKKILKKYATAKEGEK